MISVLAFRQMCIQFGVSLQKLRKKNPEHCMISVPDIEVQNLGFRAQIKGEQTWFPRALGLVVWPIVFLPLHFCQGASPNDKNFQDHIAGLTGNGAGTVGWGGFEIGKLIRIRSNTAVDITDERPCVLH
jgi:hypothetical protein